jgi:hypothetical protein
VPGIARQRADHAILCDPEPTGLEGQFQYRTALARARGGLRLLSVTGFLASLRPRLGSSRLPTDHAGMARVSRGAYDLDLVRGMRVNRGLVCGRPLILAVMSGDRGDVLWEAFVVAMLATGPAVERRSRYGDKPALFTAAPALRLLAFWVERWVVPPTSHVNITMFEDCNLAGEISHE